MGCCFACAAVEEPGLRSVRRVDFLPIFLITNASLTLLLWISAADKLDYIQGMGFDAIWISPVVDNLAGTTATGEAYHGCVLYLGDQPALGGPTDCVFCVCSYWSLDISKTNDKFGTSDDLKALSAALHSRGMYLMVDVVRILLPNPIL